MSKKPKLPTLMQMTGERPRCQYCDEPLKPYTSWFMMPGHLTKPPTFEEIQVVVNEIRKRGFTPCLLPTNEDCYQPEWVYRLTHSKSIYNSQPETRVSYWTGRYEGYGWSKDNIRMFCGTNCAVQFATSCHNAGMRIKRKDNQ